LSVVSIYLVQTAKNLVMYKLSLDRLDVKLVGVDELTKPVSQ